ncbi:conserved hypothetical protein [Pediculus humanus corporis]|uniref:Uncharacterized protein n=1 Tax=Pediculus humanus subsp. corporis TaxID=121224 RepID=E0W3J7_PEDHC|nr:uncharacterized protein Phum_PHUM605260 [Pediculus humanus corporis]EEB20203.1 conserved hypothetical protein [Pediculus humanus corporis]
MQFHIIRLRCKSPTAATQKIEKVISVCQEEIKLTILREALEILGGGGGGDTKKESNKNGDRIKRSKRNSSFSEDEQRIAGCLLQCVYKKVNAVDSGGYPTVEGLVNLYTEGINERGYFLATAQAVQQFQENSSGQMCDLAYKVFDCVSDQLAEYCSGE